LAAGSSPVHAAFTPINTIFPNWDPVKDVLDRVYFAGAAVFVPSIPGVAAPQYSGGGLVATRADDFGLGGVLDAATGSPGSADDQRWSGSTLTVRLAEKNAQFVYHILGYDMGAQGGFVKLIEDFRPPYSVNVAFNPGDVWAWSLQEHAGRFPTWSSKQSLNSDGTDHMITYRITGLASGYPTWLLLWENVPADSSDFDYDDIVVEIAAIPEPVTLCLLGMGALVAARRKPRRPHRHLDNA
jgi:hypothetical protein